MGLHVDQSPGPRDRRMIWRPFIQPDLQKLSQPQRIGRPPSNPPFRIDSLEIADQQQAKIGSRRQRRPPVLIGIEVSALALGKLIELLLVQQSVETLVERMSRSGRQFGMRDPKILLPLSTSASAHRHENILRRSCFGEKRNLQNRLDFNHGLLVQSYERAVRDKVSTSRAQVRPGYQRSTPEPYTPADQEVHDYVQERRARQ